MEIKERIGLAVYLYYNRDARKIGHLGDVYYHSRRLKYLILYVDKAQVDDVTRTLEGMKYVKRVSPSALSEIGKNFVGILGNHDKDS